MRTSIFFHIATIGNYQAVVDEIFAAIYSSYLIDEVDNIFLGIVGDGDVFYKKDKVIELYREAKLDSYEIPTLLMLRNFARKSDGYVLYLHTKGVSLDAWYKPQVDLLRKYMLYFTVFRSRSCKKALVSYETVGVDLHDIPSKHYSGNFWWARCDYVRMLPDFQDIDSQHGDRLKAELWICSRTQKNYGLWESRTNLYKDLYSPINYIGE